MPSMTVNELKASHRYFAVQCFNHAWDLMEKFDRTPEEDEEMVRLSLASHWHWSQRDAYSPTSRSIAHWQTSRVFALLGQVENARRYGEFCLDASQDESVGPFYRGYAYEALARAAALAGDQTALASYLDRAQEAAQIVADAHDRQELLDDLATIRVD